MSKFESETISGIAPRRVYTKMVGFRVRPDMFAFIKELARRTGKSHSVVMRAALSHGLAELDRASAEVRGETGTEP